MIQKNFERQEISLRPDQDLLQKNASVGLSVNRNRDLANIEHGSANRATQTVVENMVMNSGYIYVVVCR